MERQQVFKPLEGFFYAIKCFLKSLQHAAVFYDTSRDENPPFHSWPLQVLLIVITYPGNATFTLSLFPRTRCKAPKIWKE